MITIHQVTEWSSWSACKRNCESGIEERNRTVITNPTCGGSPCPNITVSILSISNVLLCLSTAVKFDL